MSQQFVCGGIMKYILSILGIALVCCGVFFCGDFGKQKKTSGEDFMRIHIVANSNSNQDQNIKYYVKDAVVDYLIPLLAFAVDKTQATEIVVSNFTEIQKVVNDALNKNGVFYGANISIEQEMIPTRVYDDLILQEGVYDTLKIDLGKGQGDNWWCVVFPAVCFLSSKNNENYVYISKIWDIICNVTQKNRR